MMKEEQIRLVQETFEQARPRLDMVAGLFYKRLFDVAPELRVLFRGDMTTQGRMVMNAIGLAVMGLNEPETVLPTVESLGVRHAGYGVGAEHYAPVGEALIWALEKGLGAEFSPEVREAWEAAYALLAQVMQQAAAAQMGAGAE